MKTIKNNVLMLKMVWSISHSYVIGVIFSQVLSAVIVVAGLYVNKLVINILVTENPAFQAILILYVTYITADFFLKQIQAVINHVFGNLKSIDVDEGLKKILINKTKEIDLSAYENTEFYNDSSRAYGEITGRATSVVWNLAYACNYFLVSFLVITLFFDAVLILLAVFMAAVCLIHTIFQNKAGYDFSVFLTPIDRKLNYIRSIFSEKPLAREIRIYNGSGLFLNDHKKAHRLIREERKKMYRKHDPIVHSYTMSLNLAKAIAGIYLGYKVLNNGITAGDFLFVMNSFYALSEKLTELLKIGMNFQNSSLYINSIKKILYFKPEIKENPDGATLNEMDSMDIKFCNVSFSYPNAPDKEVLKNISIHIEKGMKIALVGDNGSGKSTFINLLLYLYNPQAGYITCNDIEYKNYNTNSIRSSFGVLFQDCGLYTMTIAENIMMKIITEAESDDIWEALEFSGLTETVRSLKHGANSELMKVFSDKGVILSGGQFKKIAISRAYARGGKILTFDEPSSSLDALAEHELFQRLLKIGENKTVIFVSHRLSSVVNADKILHFSEGEIIESGTHEELMKKNGKYSKMFLLQADKYINQGGEAVWKPYEVIV
jgi:ATP-binding cassette subfamily B protein